MRRVFRYKGLAGLVSVTLGLSCAPWAGSERLLEANAGLWPVCTQLRAHTFVDLTHAFGPNTPHWKGFPAMKVRDLYTFGKDGFWAQEFTHVGQWGTHVDPPVHFHEGLRTLDQIPPVEMVLPLVVIDVHEKAAGNPDYVLSVQDILQWEAEQGRIPDSAFVAMRTDWSKRWPDNDAMQNRDEKGVAHYPGWSREALAFLCENRRIAASGHETTDTDPGVSTSQGNYECERYILGQNRYQIELMANLDQVPEKGAILICAFPKPRNGSGFPARLFAIVP